jgi:hypothetical protein
LDKKGVKWTDVKLLMHSVESLQKQCHCLQSSQQAKDVKTLTITDKIDGRLNIDMLLPVIINAGKSSNNLLDLRLYGSKFKHPVLLEVLYNLPWLENFSWNIFSR